MTSNLTAGMDQQVANMAALRAIVGPEPREQDLVELQRRYPSVNQAANAFFDGSAKGGLPNVVDGTPISPPPQQTTDMVSVTCPAGVTEGTEVQVQTQQGMMRVIVPKGVTAGTQFLAASHPLVSHFRLAAPLPPAYAQDCPSRNANGRPTHLCVFPRRHPEGKHALSAFETRPALIRARGKGEVG